MAACTSSSLRHEKKETTSPEAIIRYTNCRVLRGGGLKDGDVWVRNGLVLDPMKLFFEEKKSATVTYDCHGLIASPGFIDLQINGACGYDFSSFSSPSEVRKGLETVSKVLLQHGVTGYCPTVVTSSKEYYQKFLPLMETSDGGKHGAAILGLHLEGPFINKSKKGAHKEVYVQDEEELTKERVLSTYTTLSNAKHNISIVTLAPELPGSNDVIPWLVDKEVVVSLGHSLSDLETAERAVKNGASLITHLFNAMLPFHHRDPGIVGLITSLKLDQRPVYYGLIADGHHTHETVQRIANNANPQGVVLVTDALPLFCQERQTELFQLGEMMIERKGNKAVVAGTNNLAGGITSMNECVAQFYEATDCSIQAALEAASLHPAKVLNIKDKGHLEYGAKADIVFLTPPPSQGGGEQREGERAFDVIATVIGGEIVYESSSSENRLTVL